MFYNNIRNKKSNLVITNLVMAKNNETTIFLKNISSIFRSVTMYISHIKPFCGRTFYGRKGYRFAYFSTSRKC